MTRRQWRAAVTSSRLPARVRLALGVLAENGSDRFHDDAENLHSMTHGAIAIALGIDVSNARKALRRARDDGWLQIHRQGQRSVAQEYHFTRPGEPMDCRWLPRGSRQPSPTSSGVVR